MYAKQRDGENFADGASAKRKFNLKSFKKFFGIKKRKETLPSLGSSGLKQSQSVSDVTMPGSHLDYDSEDEIESAAGVLGSRAVSHDSIFIPEMVQDPGRPARVFSQGNVSDNIKALQAKVQANIRTGPKPFGILGKRIDDAGASSEDDGLPRSPPEMSLMHDAVKTRFSDNSKNMSSLSLAGTGSEEDEQISSGHSSRPLSPEEYQLHDANRTSIERIDGRCISPSADFDTPAFLSSFLDSSAAKHRLSVKPRNQRTSRNRRPSVVLKGESLVDLTSTEEEPELDEETTEASTEKSVDISAELDKSRRVSALDSHPSNNARSLPVEKKENKIVIVEGFQTMEEQVQLKSSELKPLRTPCIDVIDHPDIKVEGTTKVENDFVERFHNKQAKNAPRQLSIGDGGLELVLEEKTPCKKDKHLTSSLSGNEKNILKYNTIATEKQGFVLETPPVHEPVVAQSKTDQLGHPLDSLRNSRSHSQTSQSPLSVDFSSSHHDQRTQEHPDKENHSLIGNIDKKIEKPTSDSNTQRKFSVSSAWERPRGGSFSLKASVEAEAVKNMKLSLPKTGMSLSEKVKEDPKPPGTRTETKMSTWKKETLTDLDSVSAEKVALGNITPAQSSILAASDLSASTDSQTGSEDKNPFFVKLRSTSLSLRYRDEMKPESSRVNRHSAELRQEKAGQLTLSKNDSTEPTKADFDSKNENPKSKTNVNELTHVKPPLPKKPVLQNITVVDDDTNKEASVSVSSHERTAKSPETKTENVASERRPSLQKGMEKSTPPMAVTEPVKSVERGGQPSWVSMALQKQRGLKEEQNPVEDKSVHQEPEKQMKDKGVIETNIKQQSDLLTNKTTNTATDIPDSCGQETKAELKDQRPRANTLSQPTHATQLSLQTEKEEKTAVKQASHSATGEPSWMELAKKKSQAWSDMPQKIK
ncbi:CRACD-like protein [Spea bombifrons]|uniref:CRACD-like protein n=1 Tax=Spea bombifrons TaxID=233779 RepID=UPI00234BE279|nr:CRACD-like protein [Spea bombifrons]XP_053311139.1 CRACD-like protein [Spea bombifrons]XP_053311140.1 CRACD-like protein [Spea bombifrons]